MSALIQTQVVFFFYFRTDDFEGRALTCLAKLDSTNEGLVFNKSQFESLLGEEENSVGLTGGDTKRIFELLTGPENENYSLQEILQIIIDDQKNSSLG